MNELNIWTSYHLKEIPKEFNIKENDNIKLFYTNDLKLKKDNINYLNKYYGELCTMYYVWKNEKSKYVGFQHYRFYITHLNLDLLKNNVCSIVYQFGYDGNYYNILKRTGINDIVLDKCLDYISKYLNINKNDLFNIFINDGLQELACNTFICSWDVFDDICKFIFGLLNYLLGDYKNEINIINSISIYKYMFNSIKKELNLDINTSNETDKCWAIYRNNGNRYYIHLIEFILGFYISLKYKDKIYINYLSELKCQYKYLKVDLHNKDIDINDFIKFYKYNIFNSIHDICIYNYRGTSLEKYINILGDLKFKYKYKYVTLLENEDHFNEYVRNNNIDECNIYKCNIDEYIDVKSPIDFYINDTYEIKKINENK